MMALKQGFYVNEKKNVFFHLFPSYVLVDIIPFTRIIIFKATIY
jgi:hypothetical protein